MVAVFHTQWTHDHHRTPAGVAASDTGDRHDDPRHPRPAAPPRRRPDADRRRTPGDLGHRSSLGRHRAHLHRRRRRRTARLGARGIHARPARCGESLESAAHRGLHPRTGRLHGRAGRAAGPCRAEGHLPERLAGRRRRQPRRADLPRPEPVPGQLRAGGRAAHQQRADPPGPDRARRGRAHAGLARADRGGCRGRLRRAAQRVRAGAVAHPVRRCRHPLGGPAREREEVRAPRRQGAGAHAAAHPHPERRPARRRCRRSADGDHRPHRRPRGRPAHERRRRARPCVHHRRAHERGLLPGDARARRGHQPRPGLRALRRPALGRDGRARHRAGARVRERRSTRSTPASCWRTTARRRSTGSGTSTISRSRRSSRSWPTWATSSSSSPSPASTP